MFRISAVLLLIEGCGAYSRAVHISIFAFTCGSYSGATLNGEVLFRVNTVLATIQPKIQWFKKN